MLLAHHYVPLAFPLLVVAAEELTVAIAVGMRRSVLFPPQPQGDVFVFLKLFVDVRKVRKVAGRGTRSVHIGGNKAASSSASDICSGSGQDKPAAVNRRRYSYTGSRI